MTRKLQHHILSGALKGSIFSGKLFYYEKLSSTNDMAKQMAHEGAENGTVIVADDQSAGRGRMGRHWFSKPCSNLLFSILLRPDIGVDDLFILTMLLALAGAEAIERETKVKALIKWPNDLYVGEKKLAGILTEFSVLGKKLEYVILGMGMNVNWTPRESGMENPGDGDSKRGPGLIYPATSLMDETGNEISREQLLADILLSYDHYYREVSEHGPFRVERLWNKRSMLKGRYVTVDRGIEGKLSGIVEGIDEKGALVVLDERGKRHKIMNGDVHLVMSEKK